MYITAFCKFGFFHVCLDLQLLICVVTCTHWAAWCPSSTVDIPKAPWSWSWVTGWTTAGKTFSHHVSFHYYSCYVCLFKFLLAHHKYKQVFCIFSSHLYSGTEFWPLTMICWVSLTLSLSSGLQCSSPTPRMPSTCILEWSLWAGYGDPHTSGVFSVCVKP